MMKMSEYGLITFLEEYIEALKKPIRFKYSIFSSLDIATISKNIKEIANILREKNLWKKPKKKNGNYI